ncbi:MAG: glycosyltransferase [Prevotellaceae bacterium]|jgi:glycosyltransferase involved in cell wall biosynthesis|nr:glycosyltransferase [Prevotellaceae bacterium]
MISVVVSVYKHLDNLYLILLGLKRQSFKDFEVIISEDDDSPEMVEFVEQMRKEFNFPIKHVSHEDRGFRKCRILNNAITISSGDKLVFLDGDCIPHRHSLRNYNKNIEEGTICCGRRVMLSESLTKKIKNKKSLRYINFVSILLSGSKQVKHALYLPFIRPIKNSYCILGCNWGIMKSDIISVNAFDMDYEIIGIGEDTDIDWCLKKKGMIIRKSTQSSLAYHLYHKERYSTKSTTSNIVMLRQKWEEDNIYCKNGISEVGSLA